MCAAIAEAVCCFSDATQQSASLSTDNVIRTTAANLNLSLSQSHRASRQSERKFKGGTADCFYGHKSPMSCLRTGTKWEGKGREGRGLDTMTEMTPGGRRSLEHH